VLFLKKKYLTPPSPPIANTMAKRPLEHAGQETHALIPKKRKILHTAPPAGGLRGGGGTSNPLSTPPAEIPHPVISNVVSTFKSSNGTKKLDLLRFSQVYGFEFQPSR